MQTRTIVRQWDSSLGVIIPKEIVEKEKIIATDELIIDVKKETDIVSLFGSLKLKKLVHRLKDEGRKGW